MEDKLSYEAINGIVETIHKWLDQAPSYVVDLVHRYGSFYAYSHIRWAFWFLAVFILCVWAVVRWIKLMRDGDDDYWMALAIVGTMIGLICLPCFFGFVIEATQWFVVPEVALINSLRWWCN